MDYMHVFTNWAFKNKAAVTLITVFILFLGVFSYFKLPMEFLPSADNPQVSIITIGQVADSKTMEDEVTSPIERAVRGIKGKSSIYSTTGEGFSQVNLNFESGSDMKQAKLDVQEALNNVVLPQNISKPIVSQLNTSMIPIVNLAITFKDGLTTENLDLVKEEFEPLYKDIKGVSDVIPFGNTNPVISVKIDNKKMAQNKVSLQNVMQVLNGRNTGVAIGEKVIDGKTSNIKVVGNLTSIDRLKAVRVTPNTTLGEISKIEESKNDSMINRYNGKDVIALSIAKDSQSNAVTISKEVKKVTEQINEKYPNQESTVYISAADLVETSVQSMVKEVLLGALFATVVIMVFLRNLRSTFITIVSIPLSLAFTMFLLNLSGVTLNILTLGGVAVAIGRLVDDSIVVIENIYRKMQREKFSVQMVLDAAKEVGAAITASTLTTVAVFLPVALLNGGLREFLLPFSLTVTYSLLASLLVALTVVPLMSAGLLKKTKLSEHRPAKRFPQFVKWSLNHKWIVLTISFLLFVGSIATYFAMPKGAVDNSSADYVYASLSYPNDKPIEDVKENALKLEKTIRNISDVEDVFLQLGSSSEMAKYGQVSSPTEAIFSIFVSDKANIDTILDQIEKQKENYDGAKLEVSALSFMSMGAGGTDITIDVTGNNLKELEETTEAITKNIKDIDGIEEVSTNLEEKKPIYSIQVDSRKANTEQIAGQLGVMLNKTPIGTITVNDKSTQVMLEPVMNPKNPEDLKNITVMTDTGIKRVSQIATVKSEESATKQFHKDGDTYLRVTATVDPAKLSEISSAINLEIFGDNKENKGINIPEDVEVFVDVKCSTS